jgi:broad specificity phosphatase PhoE
VDLPARLSVFGLYITHPQVKIDPAVPVPKWGLSEIGSARAHMAANTWARQWRRIVSSDETKAIETAVGVTENDRSATGFLPPPEFEDAANWFFAHPEESFKGWERAIDAQRRIVSAVERVLSGHDETGPIAFVGHGGVGTLLKCHLEGRPIGRDRDQPAGGGNLYCFSLADRRLSCDWTPIEKWQGWM